jgi:ubiquinone/menaquinone biosynthesis C-methylase UbiE
VATLVGAIGRNCSHLQGLRLWAGDSVALDTRSDGNSLPIKQPTQACRKHQWLAGDAFTVDFGIEFEAVLLTNLLHHFSKSECERILRRIYECLNPGGRLFILEFVPNADRVTPPIPASFSLTMLVLTPEGDAYTMEELDSMLVNTGFTPGELMQAPQSPEQMMSAAKPAGKGRGY